MSALTEEGMAKVLAIARDHQRATYCSTPMCGGAYGGVDRIEGRVCLVSSCPCGCSNDHADLSDDEVVALLEWALAAAFGQCGDCGAPVSPA